MGSNICIMEGVVAMINIMRELMKRWRFRISGGFLIASIIVLMDELIKEGYAFDIFDLFNSSITHEKIFAILLIFAIILGLRKSPKAIEHHAHGGRIRSSKRGR